MTEQDSAGMDDIDEPGSTEDSFFKGKRPWSVIKDEVLRSYMRPYIAKVAKLGRPIILIDGFAGPGKFGDGSEGSPLIICQAAEERAKNKYLAIFVNRQKSHHDQLSHVLGDLIEKGKVVAIHGTAETLLAKVKDLLGDHTVFLYLDPFGLRGCEFSTIAPFVKRNKAFSTEIVINLSIPTIHRLAARKAVAEGRQGTPQVRSFHHRLSQILGGDYWQKILWDDSEDHEAKAKKVMAIYREKILGLDMPYTGSCPAREKEGSGIKYYITFCSRHQDALLLMNDSMCSAYQERMHEAATEGTLFQNTPWKDTRSPRALEELIINIVRQKPRKSRQDIWIEIVRGSFMQYTSSEYKKAVTRLVKGPAKRLDFEDVRGTGLLNDVSRLYLTEALRR